VTSFSPEIVFPCERIPLSNAVLNLSRSDIDTPIVCALAAEADIAITKAASMVFLIIHLRKIFIELRFYKESLVNILLFDIRYKLEIH
jgi:DNA-binding NarL/FixJ family response regulator